MTDRKFTVDGNSTRRQALKATVAGAATAAGLTTAAAAEDCDVTEEDRQRVRDRYGTQEQLIETIRSLDGLDRELDERDLVAGEDAAVLIYAPVVDCEPIPEYRVYRRASEDRNLTIQARAISNTGYGIVRPDEDLEHPCETIWQAQTCNQWCYQDDCCSCEYLYQCGCEGADVPCDPIYCCRRCDCTCNSVNCPFHCEFELMPDSIDVEVGWLEEAVYG